MKRLFTLLTLILLVTTAMAQTREYRYGKRGYFGSATAAYAMHNNTHPGFSAEIVNGYSFNPWFMLGGGVGAVWYNSQGNGTGKGYAFVHLRANVLDRRVTPFFALNIGGGYCQGYLKGFRDGKPEELNGHYGFYCAEPKVGVGIRMKNGHIIDLGASLYMDAGRGVDAAFKIGIGYNW